MARKRKAFNVKTKYGGRDNLNNYYHRNNYYADSTNIKT